MDLSDFAGLFIFCIIGGGIFLGYSGYKMQGRFGAGSSAALAIIGMWIALGIIKACDFDDGSSETVFTIMFCTLIPPSIYNLSLYSKWKTDKKNEEIRRKIQCCEQEIKSLEKELDYRSTIFNLITLIKKCGGDLCEIENNKEFIEAAKINQEITGKKTEIRQLQYELQDI